MGEQNPFELDIEATPDGGVVEKQPGESKLDVATNKSDIEELQWKLDTLEKQIATIASSSSSSSSSDSTGMKMGMPGLHSTGALAANILYACRVACVRTGTVKGVTIWLQSTNAGNIKAAIYNDDGGIPALPSTLLVAANTGIAISAAEDYYQRVITFDSEAEVIAGKSYWVTFLSNANMGLYIAQGTSQAGKYKTAEPYASGFDNPWPGTTGSNVQFTHAVY